jgi:hypothetical protein
MKSLSCRGYKCLNTSLINAHIIPRGFARDTMDGYTHNMKISMDNVGITQHGVYDANILCKDCDNNLGKYDDYALGVCRRFPQEHISIEDGTFEMAGVDGDLLAKFVLSVLWRASITSRPEFRSVALAACEVEAGEVIFEARPLRSMPNYELMLGRYISGIINPARNYTAPSRFKIAGLDGWGFALGGFRVMAKIDMRPLPSELRPAIVNGNTKLIGAFVNYETTTEGQAMLNMARAHRERSGKSQP